MELSNEERQLLLQAIRCYQGTYNLNDEVAGKYDALFSKLVEE